jgi:UDP-N-acetylmuramoyl-tripeptide--D-alanyl-D-alanine ligase
VLVTDLGTALVLAWTAIGVTLLAFLAVLVLGGLRFLRVAQREHYIAPWTTRMVWLWVRVVPLNAVLLAIAIIATVVGVLTGGAIFTLLALVIVLLLPWGLGVRGTSAKLAWTPRAKRLAVAWAVLMVVIAVLIVVLAGIRALPVVALVAAPIMDLALVVMKPIEKSLSKKYLVSARKRLGQVRPRIVAITGSYGKTSTKNYVAHVLSGSFSTVASPASFNNLLGLSRAVNDRVVPGTEVFVAEMGVYGTGEIRELSESFPPDIAAITVIGEAHLARMGTRETIFRAKSEITEKASTVVLPIDDPLLRDLADRCEREGKRVIRVSTEAGTDADVVVADGVVTVREGADRATAPVSLPNVGHAVNIAVTVGIAVAMNLPLAAIASRLEALPDSPHRAEVQIAPSGLAVIDDTYNANPVGAERAVGGAAELAAERGGALIVVTPGMVELGSVQEIRNEAFAASVTERGGELFAVARTNRHALVAGAARGGRPARTFDTREQAVAAALDQAGDRGVILYENDLPDHYP